MVEYPEIVQKAIGLATEAHEGQMRKFEGGPYIQHPLRVMETVRALGHSDATMATAVLHDTVEDTELNIEDLAREGFNKDVLNPIELLTRHEGVTYEEFINRLLISPRARVVKMADLFDNMNLVGNTNPSVRDLERIEKYGLAIVSIARFGQPKI